MAISFTGISCLLLSVGTGAYFINVSRYAFQKRTMNVYTYLMYILIFSGIVGKSP